MQLAYIKFNSRADQLRGFYELATKAQVTSLPGGVYAVPWKALSLLDEESISYRRATENLHLPRSERILLRSEKAVVHFQSQEIKSDAGNP